MEDKFVKPPDFMARVASQKALVPRKETITERYTVKHKVLGLGVNGKVLECIFNQTGEKRALKVSCVTTYVRGSRRDQVLVCVRMEKVSQSPTIQVHHYHPQIRKPSWGPAIVLSRYALLYVRLYRQECVCVCRRNETRRTV